MRKYASLVVLIGMLGVTSAAQADTVARAMHAGLQIGPAAAQAMREAPKGTCLHNPLLRRCGHLRGVRPAPRAVSGPFQPAYGPGNPCYIDDYRLTTTMFFGYLHVASDAYQWCRANLGIRDTGLYVQLWEYWLMPGQVGWHHMKDGLVSKGYGGGRRLYAGVNKRCTDPGDRDWSMKARGWFESGGFLWFASWHPRTHPLFCS